MFTVPPYCIHKPAYIYRYRYSIHIPIYCIQVHVYTVYRYLSMLYSGICLFSIPVFVDIQYCTVYVYAYIQVCVYTLYRYVYTLYRYMSIFYTGMSILYTGICIREPNRHALSHIYGSPVKSHHSIVFTTQLHLNMLQIVETVIKTHK